MGMFKRKRYREVHMEFTPLIDLVFSLVMFFAVTTTIIPPNQGITIELPKAETVNENKQALTLSITSDKKFFLNSREVLPSQIESIVKEIIRRDKHAQIIISGHKSVPYETIIQTMDSIRLGGCFDLILEAEKKTP